MTEWTVLGSRPSARHFPLLRHSVTSYCLPYCPNYRIAIKYALLRFKMRSGAGVPGARF